MTKLFGKKEDDVKFSIDVNGLNRVLASSGYKVVKDEAGPSVSPNNSSFIEDTGLVLRGLGRSIRSKFNETMNEANKTVLTLKQAGK